MESKNILQDLMTVSSILSLPPLPTWPLKLKVILKKCKYVYIYFLVILFKSFLFPAGQLMQVFSYPNMPTYGPKELKKKSCNVFLPTICPLTRSQSFLSVWRPPVEFCKIWVWYLCSKFPPLAENDKYLFCRPSVIICVSH